jgi:N-acetylglucosamine-6-phosphate deacetylase
MVLLSSLSAGYASSELQSQTFNAIAVVSSMKFPGTEVFTYILLSHPVEFRCQICQIEDDKLAGSCATCMSEKTLNEELGKQEGKRTTEKPLDKRSG